MKEARAERAFLRAEALGLPASCCDRNGSRLHFVSVSLLFRSDKTGGEYCLCICGLSSQLNLQIQYNFNYWTNRVLRDTRCFIGSVCFAMPHGKDPLIFTMLRKNLCSPQAHTPMLSDGYLPVSNWCASASDL